LLKLLKYPFLFFFKLLLLLILLLFSDFGRFFLLLDILLIFLLLLEVFDLLGMPLAGNVFVPIILTVKLLAACLTVILLPFFQWLYFILD
jgi:hypothetical protein